MVLQYLLGSEALRVDFGCSGLSDNFLCNCFWTDNAMESLSDLKVIVLVFGSDALCETVL